MNHSFFRYTIITNVKPDDKTSSIVNAINGFEIIEDSIGLTFEDIHSSVCLFGFLFFFQDSENVC
jgi:hypothetical protein